MKLDEQAAMVQFLGMTGAGTVGAMLLAASLRRLLRTSFAQAFICALVIALVALLVTMVSYVMSEWTMLWWKVFTDPKEWG